LADKIAPVRIGTRVAFDDRWQGRVSGLEADENWNVYNVSVASGFLFASRSVRLPFSSVSAWSDNHVRISANSFTAFAREIPPVAAPARPLDASTPISLPGTRFAGLVVRQQDRRAVEVILTRGVGALYRVPISQISFTAKTMTVGIQTELLVRYHPDPDIHDEVHNRIAEDAAIPTEDKRFVHADVEEGVVILSGNVRVDQTRDHIGLVVSQVDGVVSVRNEIRDDFQIEADIGQALSGVSAQHTGRVYVRSNLGEVRVDGSVAASSSAEDVIRTIARVPGVRSAINRLRAGAAAFSS
jgi:osmotically-inducible protein OsmY